MSLPVPTMVGIPFIQNITKTHPILNLNSAMHANIRHNTEQHPDHMIMHTEFHTFSSFLSFFSFFPLLVPQKSDPVWVCWSWSSPLLLEVHYNGCIIL